MPLHQRVVSQPAAFPATQLNIQRRYISADASPESQAVRDVESAIKAVEDKIIETEIELKAAQDPTVQQFLRFKEQQLRSKEQQLRSKEQFLLSEQQRLRTREQELRADAKQFPNAGSVQYPGAQTVQIGLSQGVWAIMSQEVQERVLQLLDARKSLGAVKALHHMRSELSVADASKFGIEVLHSRDGKVQLGYFDVPDVQVFLESPPKGFTVLSTCHYYYAPRAKLIEEFIAALEAFQKRRLDSGVLLSGPNGVGKTAIGLQAFECCMVLGHLAVYIPDAKVWVAEAALGAGDEYLLEQFFWQNVDKIASTPKLCSIFRDRLRGAPVKAAMMRDLRRFLTAGAGPWPAIAIIVDEVQNITNEVAKLQGPAATYFANSWSTWNTSNNCFVRMDIASSHGKRELKLPSGDFDRLRFVAPWPLDVALAALSHKQSPAFVAQAASHVRILHVAGGVIRRLLECQKALPAGDVTYKSLAVMEHHVRSAMADDCEHWVRKLLSPADRLEVARHLLSLIRGHVSWQAVKGAYDYGLVARDESGVKAIPVSPVAASVIHRELSKVLREVPPSPSSLAAGERGYELERQMRIRFDPIDVMMKTMQLDGSEGPAIHVRADYVEFFHQLDQTTTPSTNSVCFVPFQEKYPCDAIIVPGIDDNRSLDGESGSFDAVSGSSSTPVSPVQELKSLQVWEFSVTDPRSVKRVSNVASWFGPNGCITTLQKLHPSRPITIVLCWPDVIRSSNHEYHDVENRARKAGVSILVVDNTVLESMGVMMSKPAAQF